MGFLNWGCRGVSRFLYDFVVYQDNSSNRSNSASGVSGDVVANLCPTLSKKEDHKVLGDKFFTSLLLNEHLKSDCIWYVVTIRAPH